MNISSRTPEGQPNQCPVCGNAVILEPSHPAGDAPCPHCGYLLFSCDPSVPSPTYLKDYEELTVPDWVFEMVPMSICRENGFEPVDCVLGTLVIASDHPLSDDTIDKIGFILFQTIANVLVTQERLQSLREQHEALHEI